MNLKSLSFLPLVFTCAIGAASAAEEAPILFDTQSLHESISAELTLSMASMQEDLNQDHLGTTMLLADHQASTTELTSLQPE